MGQEVLLGGGRASPPPGAELAAFLHYGFVPRLQPGYRDLPWARVRAGDVGRAGDVARQELVARSLELLRRACSDTRGSLHVVPLSAGLDSRLLLALLLEAGIGDRVVAVTFGVPGTLDFELAPRVAQEARVRHEAIDLTALALPPQVLLDTARRYPWTPLLELHYNHQIQRRFGTAATYWSGCMANTLAGKDKDVPAGDWETACREFAERSRIVRSVRLTPPGFDPRSALPEGPLLADSPFTGYEQLNSFLKYPLRNDPALVPRGYDVRTPFRDPAWVEFMLRLPLEVLEDPGFYPDIVRLANPRLYRLPSKNRLGLPSDAAEWRVQARRAALKAQRLVKARFPRRVRRVNPKANLADVDAELRAPTPLRERVEESVLRLRERGVLPWLDPLALWRRHQGWRANHGDALTLLLALELNLAVRERAVPAAV